MSLWFWAYLLASLAFALALGRVFALQRQVERALKGWQETLDAWEADINRFRVIPGDEWKQ